MKTRNIPSQLLQFAVTGLLFFTQVNLLNAAPTDVTYSNHTALAQHYENLAVEAKKRLKENQAILKKYEAYPYYYGRQGQDLQSHTAANIREYEKVLQENLSNAGFHKKMAEKSNYPAQKARLNYRDNLLVN